MALDITLAEFKNKVGIGTRANRYSVTFSIPAASTGSGGTITAEASALTIPAADLTPIPVPFRARILKIPGDRKYGPWEITMYDSPIAFGSSSSYIWQALHNWSNKINNHVDNTTNWGPDDQNYVRNWKVEHWDLNGTRKLKEMTLHNCWPSMVGPVALASGEMDTLVQFGCVLEYEYLTYT